MTYHFKTGFVYLQKTDEIHEFSGDFESPKEFAKSFACFLIEQELLYKIKVISHETHISEYRPEDGEE